MKQKIFNSNLELAKLGRKGIDYFFEHKNRSSPVLIMAPHGGKIEKFTSELAEEIAGEDLSLYAFIGNKRSHNRSLHITSHQFDEPIAIKAVSHADLVVTIHGHRNETEEFVMVGGLYATVIGRLVLELERAGFLCKRSEERVEGSNRNNICNRGRLGKGIQLEISSKLRSRLRADVPLRKLFVDTIRRLLAAYRESPGT